MLGPELTGVTEHRQTDQEITEVNPRVHLVPPAGGDEAEVDSRGARSTLVGAEQPVVAAHGNMLLPLLGDFNIDNEKAAPKLPTY